MTVSQKAAVFAATSAVLTEAGVDLDGRPVLTVITEDQKETVISMVAAGLANGAVQFSADAQLKYDTPAKIRTYTVGMVGNWFRRDERLNGGIKNPEAKNPGSRTGSGDKTLQALKQLSKVHAANPEAMVKINAAIETRKNELLAEKAKKIEIDVNALPEHLRNLL